MKHLSVGPFLVQRTSEPIKFGYEDGFLEERSRVSKLLFFFWWGTVARRNIWSVVVAQQLAPAGAMGLSFLSTLISNFQKCALPLFLSSLLFQKIWGTVCAVVYSFYKRVIFGAEGGIV
jgi:hypothetical protein